MNKKERLRVLIDTAKKFRLSIFILLLVFAVQRVVFWFYEIKTEPLLYALCIALFVLIISFIAVYCKNLNAAQKRRRFCALADGGTKKPPKGETLAEQDYLNLIKSMQEKIFAQAEQFNTERQDMTDYYIQWVHQIKTPIAVMRMLIADNEPQNSRELNWELFRIEQYVDMVLQYIRLGSSSQDYFIKEYPLDDLIRESIHKYAPQFVMRKIKLNYTGTDRKITTDKKWFCCILDQLLSNAVKYTPKGSVTIFINEQNQLCVEDTGIGIAAEDIPRIFEKGYTGQNGRLNQKSSGLGLYLAHKAAENLSLGLTVESTAGKGTSFYISF